MAMSGRNSSLAAGAADESGMEPWRELFRGRDIYDVISKAILVAATDSPQEFRRRRDGIVEQIYTAPTVPIPQAGRGAAGEGEPRRSGRALEVSDKGSKVGSCTVAPAPAEEPEDNNNNDKKKGIAVAGAAAQDQHANGSGDNADADFGATGMDEMDWLQSLAEEVDAETKEINEVLRIKEILLNHHEQSADILFDSLRRLHLMHLTADKIKSTEIRGAVAAVSNHKSHKIRMLVHEIVKDWKTVVDDWIAITKATMDIDSSKHMDISKIIATEDEGGLATPPMDIGALYHVNHGTAIQNVSEFLHCMDDDRIRTNLSMDKGRDCDVSNSEFDGSKPSNRTTPWSKDPMIVQALPAVQASPFNDRNQKELPARKTKLSSNASLLVTYKKTQEEEGSQVPRVHIKVKHSSAGCAPRVHSKQTLGKKKPYEENQARVPRIPPVIAVGELQPHHVVKKEMPSQSSAGPEAGTWKRNVELSKMDIDETKRKLRGAYQQAENLKKRRAIQIVEPCDITKSRDNRKASRSHTMNRSKIIKR